MAGWRGNRLRLHRRVEADGQRPWWFRRRHPPLPGRECTVAVATIGDYVQVVAVIGERESNVASLWAYIDTAYTVFTAMVGLRLLRAAMRL